MRMTNSSSIAVQMVHPEALSMMFKQAVCDKECLCAVPDVYICFSNTIELYWSRLLLCLCLNLAMIKKTIRDQVVSNSGRESSPGLLFRLNYTTEGQGAVVNFKKSKEKQEQQLEMTPQNRWMKKNKGFKSG